MWACHRPGDTFKRSTLDGGADCISWFATLGEFTLEHLEHKEKLRVTGFQPNS
ncbi:hypothetical protein SBDP1_1190025 [Syntrophobacter sp. SbD1]|nr:hypothetical protein SBDP1_1190025 [Syntrophobacter sp. SbD1]